MVANSQFRWRRGSTIGGRERYWQSCSEGWGLIARSVPYRGCSTGGGGRGRGKGGGGESTPLYSLNGNVRPDRVWF